MNGSSGYRIRWHKEVDADLQAIHPDVAKNIVVNFQRKVSSAPFLIGKPLQGVGKMLRKVAFSDYRIVFTVDERIMEITVLCVRHRKDIYRKSNLRRLYELALSLKG